MSRLIILGCGGHGRVIADMAERVGVYTSIVFLDNDPDAGDRVGGMKILGPFSELESIASREDHCVVGIGDNQLRSKLTAVVESLHVPLVTIIDPSASVSDGSVLGAGTVVMPRAVVNTGSVVGRGCIINTASSVDHDCRISEFVHISPGANIGGDVRIGECSWIGIGSSVRHGISIGRGAMIGAGASVVACVDDGVTVVGVPAKPMV
ncbi:MAG TPA: acetyltransferase [Phycisphaerales bacterium]|nr:acetyltransferase [Phycisphaerales bacterium]